MGESMKHSVIWQMLLPIPIVSGIAIAAAAYFVPPLIASDAIESALAEAQRTVGQFRTLRGYYTKAVVSKATKAGALKAGFDHRDKADVIPLPATMIQDLSGLLQQQGTSMNLYSPYPFPNRAGRKLDDFGASAWDALSRNPDSVFSRREVVGGKDMLRVAVADRMSDASCVTCHNTLANSPKTDWKLGDVRGVLEVDADLGTALARGERLTRFILIGALAAAILLAVTAMFVARRISSPLKALTQLMRHLASGDKTVSVTDSGRKDEIGQMTAAMAVFRESMIENDRLVAEQNEAKAQAAIQQSAALHRMADAFEQSVGGIVGAVASTATEMERAAQTMERTAQGTRQQTGTVASASDQAATSVQSVAAATEELAASISEIARQASRSAEIAAEATREAQRTDDSVTGLAGFVEKIGTVLNSSRTSRARPTCWRSTPPSKRLGPASTAGALRSSPAK
jgi:HAMP domain-containing protein